VSFYFYCITGIVRILTLNRLVSKNPSGFREGDIVEIGFSVVAFKGNRDSKGFVCLVMNSLVFLDGSHTRVQDPIAYCQPH
jgi:hypothetical protein